MPSVFEKRRDVVSPLFILFDVHSHSCVNTPRQTFSSGKIFCSFMLSELGLHFLALHCQISTSTNKGKEKRKRE